MRSGDDQEWRTLAACRSADPELFFPISEHGPARVQIAQAKSVCAHCRVRAECLDFAVATRQGHGIWGGMTEDERLALWQKQARNDDHVGSHVTGTGTGSI